MKTTGVAVIGSGGIGTLRAHSCTQIPQVDYLAVCDTKQEKLGDLAAATNADMRTSDYEEAIKFGSTCIRIGEGFFGKRV